jgi:hypothetical protein
VVKTLFAKSATFPQSDDVTLETARLQFQVPASTQTWGRRYDHNFLRFLPIFGEKFGVFLKNHCYDHIFAKTSNSLSKKRQNFRQIFRRKYFTKSPIFIDRDKYFVK